MDLRGIELPPGQPALLPMSALRNSESGRSLEIRWPVALYSGMDLGSGHHTRLQMPARRENATVRPADCQCLRIGGAESATSQPARLHTSAHRGARLSQEETRNRCEPPGPSLNSPGIVPE